MFDWAKEQGNADMINAFEALLPENMRRSGTDGTATNGAGKVRAATVAGGAVAVSSAAAKAAKAAKAGKAEGKAGIDSLALGRRISHGEFKRRTPAYPRDNAHTPTIILTSSEESAEDVALVSAAAAASTTPFKVGGGDKGESGGATDSRTASASVGSPLPALP
eukprot:gene32034-21743_t